MSNILNKSNHPVQVKKIPITVWKLRDEIEMAISLRLQEFSEKESSEVDISDIKDFYIGALNQVDQDQDENSSEEAEEDSNLDSSGNPMDDDALAMMAALGGGEEDSNSDQSQESESETEEENTETSEDGEDDEAAAMAAAMLADQGMGNSEAKEEDDEAAALAASMLADQGMSGDDDAAALAASMLADQGAADSSAEEEKRPKPFSRPIPLKDKQAQGFSLLSDIQMDKLLFFTNQNFIQGQNIILKLKVPKPFTLIIEVLLCTYSGRKSKIISPNRFDYRVAGKILYKFPGERSQLREFLQSIEPDIPDPPKKLKRPEADEEDDDFDDLGF